MIIQQRNRVDRSVNQHESFFIRRHLWSCFPTITLQVMNEQAFLGTVVHINSIDDKVSICYYNKSDY